MLLFVYSGPSKWPFLCKITQIILVSIVLYDISLHPGYFELYFVISIFNHFSLLLTSLIFHFLFSYFPAFLF